MESGSETETDGKFPEILKVRRGNVLVVSIPGAPKASVKETNEWIRKSRDGNLADGGQARTEISGSGCS
jgi:hypothetical protein